MELHRGSTRLVLLVGRWAIKVPYAGEWRLFLHGLLANLQEARWSRETAGFPPDDPARLRLARVHWSLPGGWLVVQERAYIPRNFYRKFIRQGELGRMRHVFDGLPYDGNEYNFGFIGRRLVLVDYGS